jgi:serine/threonine protein kinase
LDSEASLLTGIAMTQIGRYDIVRKTGIYGLSAVYEAFDRKMQRPVTLRIAEHRPADPEGFDEQAREAIRCDAKQLAQLDHPNIVKVLSCEELEGNPVLVMEQFESRSLSALMADGSALPAEQVLEILKSAAAGLDHAHAKGLIYRNLSPASLLVNEEGLLKISGFDSAGPGRMSAEPSDDDLDLLFDSIPYIAPEVLRGDPPDPRADQFSLAAVGLHALSGAAPVAAAAPVARMRQILFEQIPVRERLGGERAPALGAVFERALSKSPAARYSSCSEFASAMGAALTGRAASLTRVAVLPVAPEAGQVKEATAHPVFEFSDLLTQAEPRSLTPWVVATAAIVILAVISAFFLLRSPARPSKAVGTAPLATPTPAGKEAPLVVLPAPAPRPSNPTASASKTVQQRPAKAPRKKKEVIEKAEPEPTEPIAPEKPGKVFVKLPGQQ